MSDNFKLTELDFTQIKNNLKDYLRSKSEYQDFDFDGSGWSYLIDLLAYNTIYNSYYTNMVANEMFIDSAILRTSVVSKAKLLGYLPRSRQSARAKIKVEFIVDPLNIPSSIYISRDVKFSSTINGKTYIFNVIEPQHIYPDRNGNFVIEELEIIEGDRLTHSFVVDNNNTNQRFILPNKYVDTNTITVTIQESSFNIGLTLYTRATDITEITSSSKVYFLQEVDDNQIEVYFGDDILSYKPKTGNIIRIEYIVSNGSDANGIKSFQSISGIGDPTDGNITAERITVVQQAVGGLSEESIKSIKYIAPLNFEAQNRGVTKSDFEFLIKRDYENVDSVIVWGGEDNVPAQYGSVFFAIKPRNGYILNTSEKELLKNNIIKNNSTLCVTPVIVDPEYINIIVDTYVKYNYQQTYRTKQELQKDIYDFILNYGNTELEKFGHGFEYSKFIEQIDGINPAILNNITKIKLRSRIYPTLGIKQQHIIKYNNILDIYDSSDYYSKAIHSTDFMYVGCSCFFAEENFGSTNLCIFRRDSKSASTLIKVEDAGTIDYVNGIITIDKFVPDSWISTLNYIDFVVKPKSYNIDPKRNQILLIESEDVVVRVESVK